MVITPQNEIAKNTTDHEPGWACEIRAAASIGSQLAG